VRSPEALTAPPLTVGLPFSIAGVRPERPAAGPAFVRVFHARPIRLPEGAWGLQARKKNQKEEGRRAFRKRAGRKSSRRRRNFKPPDLPHFHSAADTRLTPGKASFLQSGRRVENYAVQSGPQSLELSSFVVGDRVYRALLTASTNSEELVKRWKVGLNEAAPSLPLRVVVETNQRNAHSISNATSRSRLRRTQPETR